MTTPTRRTVLRTGAAAGALGTAALAPTLAPGALAAPGAARADRRTFAHGVASGDPLVSYANWQAGMVAAHRGIAARDDSGNHGHPATRPIPFFLSGGHPAVPRRTARPGLATTADVAPTVGEFLGLPAPRGGYDGRSRL